MDHPHGLTSRSSADRLPLFTSSWICCLSRSKSSRKRFSAVWKSDRSLDASARDYNARIPPGIRRECPAYLR